MEAEVHSRKDEESGSYANLPYLESTELEDLCPLASAAPGTWPGRTVRGLACPPGSRLDKVKTPTIKPASCHTGSKHAPEYSGADQSGKINVQIG